MCPSLLTTVALPDVPMVQNHISMGRKHLNSLRNVVKDTLLRGTNSIRSTMRRRRTRRSKPLMSRYTVYHNADKHEVDGRNNNNNNTNSNTNNNTIMNNNNCNSVNGYHQSSDRSHVNQKPLEGIVHDGVANTNSHTYVRVRASTAHNTNKHAAAAYTQTNTNATTIHINNVHAMGGRARGVSNTTHLLHPNPTHTRILSTNDKRSRVHIPRVVRAFVWYAFVACLLVLCAVLARTRTYVWELVFATPSCTMPSNGFWLT